MQKENSYSVFTIRKKSIQWRNTEAVIPKQWVIMFADFVTGCNVGVYRNPIFRACNTLKDIETTKRRRINNKTHRKKKVRNKQLKIQWIMFKWEESKNSCKMETLRVLTKRGPWKRNCSKCPRDDCSVCISLNMTLRDFCTQKRSLKAKLFKMPKRWLFCLYFPRYYVTWFLHSKAVAEREIAQNAQKITT